MASASPRWAETSVRWLRTNHPSFTVGSTARPFIELLDLSLWRMNYLRFEHVDALGWNKPLWRAHLKKLAVFWDEEDHRKMVAFLEAGGYESKVLLGAESLELEMPDGEPGPSETIAVARNGLDDLVGSDLEEAVAEALDPPAQLSPDHELQEIVDAEVAATDPRAGVW